MKQLNRTKSFCQNVILLLYVVLKFSSCRCTAPFSHKNMSPHFVNKWCLISSSALQCRFFCWQYHVVSLLQLTIIILIALTYVKWWVCLHCQDIYSILLPFWQNVNLLSCSALTYNSYFPSVCPGRGIPPHLLFLSFLPFFPIKVFLGYFFISDLSV